MRIKTILITVAIVLGIILVTVPFLNTGKKKEVKTENLPEGTHEATVLEIIQTTNYTYFRVEENDSELWIAVTKRDASIGDVLYYNKPWKMDNFVSKELNRTFPTVYFVQNVSDQPIQVDPAAPAANAAPAASATRKKDIPKMENVKVQKPGDAITIAELYEHNAKYADKTVKVRGVVSKFSRMIMGRNWAHLQDGSDFSGQYDLAVTTMDSVTEGNTVTFTGKVSINKDFGAGYFYNVIIEEAKSSDLKAGK